MTKLFDTNNKIFIGISGKKGTGKDTVANFLSTIMSGTTIANKKLNVRILSFGDPLKYEASSVYQYPLEWGYSQEGKERVVSFTMESTDPRLPTMATKIGLNNYDCKLRNILQYYATEFRRAQDPNYWTNAMDTLIVQHAMDADVIILPDVRFINELQYVLGKRLNLAIRIEPYPDYVYDDNSTHTSETELDDHMKSFHQIYKPKYGKIFLKSIAHTVYNKTVHPFLKHNLDFNSTNRILKETGVAVVDC